MKKFYFLSIIFLSLSVNALNVLPAFSFSEDNTDNPSITHPQKVTGKTSETFTDVVAPNAVIAPIETETASSANETFANYSSSTAGTLNGINFTVSALNGSSLLNYNYNNSDWNSVGQQQSIDYSFSSPTITITFASPVANLNLYLYYFRGLGDVSYTFSEEFIVTHGLNGVPTTSTSIDASNTPFASGIIQFVNPVSTLTITRSGTTSNIGFQGFNLSMTTIPESDIPNVITQNIDVNLDQSGNASITAQDIDNGSSAVTGIASLSLDKTTFDCDDLNNSPPYVSLNFEGDGHIQIDGNAPLDFGGSKGFTFESQIYPRSNANSYILSKTLGGAYWPGKLTTVVYINAQNQLVFGINRFTFGGWTYLSSDNNTINLNEWQHIAVSYNPANSNMKIFIEGVEVASTTLNTSLPDASPGLLRIGASEQGSNQFDGYMDNFRAWENELDAAEIIAVKNNILTSVNNTLLLHYAFNTNSGTEAVDLSSTERNGVFTGGLTESSWSTGVSLNFEGDGHIQIDGNAPLDFGGSNGFTFETQIYPRSNANSYIMSKTLGGAYWPGKLTTVVYINAQNQLVFGINRFTFGGWTYLSSANNTIDLNEWQHIAVSYNPANSTMKIFIEGLEVASTTLNTSLPDASPGLLRIGASEQGSNQFDGYMDNFRAWENELDAAEILAVKNNILTSVNNTLLLDYAFNTNSGAEAVDLSSTERNGVFTGGLTESSWYTGSNNSSPNGITVTLTVTSNLGDVATGTATVNVINNFSPTANASADLSVCAPETMLDGSASENYSSLQWSISSGDGNAYFDATPGALTSSNLNPDFNGTPGETYVLDLTVQGEGPCSSSDTDQVEITFYPEFTTGSILTTGETIISGGDPMEIGNSSVASGGDDNITYAWYSSTNNFISSTLIAGATMESYDPPSGLTETTSYRRFAQDESCNTSLTESSGTWTVTVDDTAPAVISLIPSDDANNIDVSNNLQVQFNESVQAGTGYIDIYRASDNFLVESIAVTSAQVSFSSDKVSINPASDLADGTTYYVQIDNTAIEDLVGNMFAGIADMVSWNFRTKGILFFQEAFTSSRGTLSSSIAFADVDYDNDQDFIISGAADRDGLGPAGNQVTRVFRNDGSGDFSIWSAGLLDGLSYTSVSAYDFNDDNILDVVYAGEDYTSGDNFIKYYTNDGSGDLTATNGRQLPFLERIDFKYADFNGDDKDDVLVIGLNASDGNARVMLFRNDGELADPPFVDIGPSLDAVENGSIAVADINGDNTIDVFISGKDSNGTKISKIYTNDGHMQFTELMGTAFDHVDSGDSDFADVDDDGDQDLLITGVDSSDNNVLKLYLNDGAGVFTEAIDAITISSDFLLEAFDFADIDGDDDMDVLFTGYNPGNFREITTIWENLLYNPIAPVFKNNTPRFNINFDEEKEDFGEAFKLVPNPTDLGYFNIYTPNLKGDATISVFDTFGKNLFTKTIPVKNGSITVSTQNLSGGLYLVSLSSRGHTFNSKLIVK